MLLISTTRTRTARTNSLRRPLQLEVLEDRTCPAGSIAPQLTYSVTEMMGMVQIQGTVVDESPMAVSVHFNGVVNGMAMPSPTGSFFLMLPASTTGVVHGQAFDNQGLNSGVIDAMFASQAPGVTFTATWGANKQVTITGQVTDESPTRTSVVFTGAIVATITPNANGTFSFTTTASQLGQITATVTDPFSQTGTASFTLTNTAPTISNFQVSIAPGRFYTFTGRVTDEFAPGLTVTFGGLASLAGKTATVAQDGTFSLTIELPTGEDGEAQVVCRDWWNTQSNLATILVI